MYPQAQYQQNQYPGPFFQPQAPYPYPVQQPEPPQRPHAVPAFPHPGVESSIIGGSRPRFTPEQVQQIMANHQQRLAQEQMHQQQMMQMQQAQQAQQAQYRQPQPQPMPVQQGHNVGTVYTPAPPPVIHQPVFGHQEQHKHPYPRQPMQINVVDPEENNPKPLFPEPVAKGSSNPVVRVENQRSKKGRVQTKTCMPRYEPPPRSEPEFEPTARYNVRPMDERYDNGWTSSASYHTRTSYVNTTGKPIYVTNTDGIVFPVSSIYPDEDEGRSFKVIQEVFIPGQKAFNELYDLVNSDNREVISDELKDLRVAFQAALPREQQRQDFSRYGVVVTRTWTVDLDDLAGRSAYIDFLGVHMSLSRTQAATCHGTGPLSQLSAFLPEAVSGIQIQVVDNESTAGDRYVYSAGDLITVRPVKSRRLESGVYVTRRDGENKQRTERLTFEEAQEKLKMYVNQNDAMSHGNPAVYYEAQYAQVKHENEMERMHFAQEMHRLQTELDRQRKESEAASHKSKEEHEAEMRRIKQEHERLMSELKTRIEEEKHRLTVEHENQLRELKEKNARLDELRKEEDRIRALRHEEEDRKRKQMFEEEDLKRKKKRDKKDRKMKRKAEQAERELKQRMEDLERQRKLAWETEARERFLKQQEEDRKREQEQEGWKWTQEKARLARIEEYEKRAAMRKDSSEILKQVPIYAGAALSAFAAIMAYKNSPRTPGMCSAIIDI